MSRQDVSKVALESIFYQVISPFIDGWILMLALGGLADNFDKPFLAIGYGSSILIIIVSICLIPQTTSIHLIVRKLLEKA